MGNAFARWSKRSQEELLACIAALPPRSVLSFGYPIVKVLRSSALQHTLAIKITVVSAVVAE